MALGLIFSLALARSNPGLIAERMKPGPGEQDRVTKIVGLLVLLLQLILAGLDAGRYHWRPAAGTTAQIAALVLAMAGYGMAAWATYTNQFFSSAVRLQPDRQQVVIDNGPYAFLRHPGYTGALLYLPLAGLALGSWLAAVGVGIPIALLLLRRTNLEDAMLRKGLPGYEEYAARVKYRLFPGIW
jgi:protein-S-isoprenylcysteine O-methyltransferase Ste14